MTRSEPPEKGPMTVREAGRKGGQQTARRHGRQHYERIGKLGGAEVRRLVQAGKEVKRPGDDGDA